MLMIRHNRALAAALAVALLVLLAASAVSAVPAVSLSASVVRPVSTPGSVAPTVGVQPRPLAHGDGGSAGPAALVLLGITLAGAVGDARRRAARCSSAMGSFGVIAPLRI